MGDAEIIKVKCPKCERLYGISPDALEQGRMVKFKYERESSCFLFQPIKTDRLS